MNDTVSKDQLSQRLQGLIQTHDPQLAQSLPKNTELIIRHRKSLRWQDRYLLIIAMVMMALLLIRGETARADVMTEVFGLELHNSQTRSTALAMDTDIDVDVTGLLARVWVKQVFRNDSLDWMEGIYRFPLPQDASVDRLQIKVGELMIEGEIQERKAAQRVYRKAKQAGKTTALVEQQKANRFQTRLANIGPGEDIQVMISFSQRVAYRDGVFSLRLPMTFTPAPDQGVAQMSSSAADTAPSVVFTSLAKSSGHGLNLDIAITSAVPLDFVESRYHDIQVQPHARGYAVALDDPGNRSDRDFELIWAPQLSQAPESAVMTWDDGESAYALLMLLPPAAGAVPEQAREVTFIIDTSGSMEGQSLTQAKAALRRGLDQLGAHDRFNVIEFNSDAQALFPQVQSANVDSLSRAYDYIRSLSANGGTNMLPALRLALDREPLDDLMRQVVFITDGAIGNEAQLFNTIRQIILDSRLFTVAIGSAPNSYFMRKAAEIGRGTFTHIGSLEEVEAEMNALWDRIQRPALADIEVDWGGAVAETFPEIVPDLYAGEPLWVTARFDFLPDQVSVSGHFDGRSWEESIAISNKIQSENVAQLWAKAKIADLENSLLFGLPPVAIREAIVDLALDYQLLTQYTAMVAVDKTPVRYQEEALKSANVGSLLPAGGSQVLAFANTAIGWQWRLLLSLIALLGVVSLYLLSCHTRSGTNRAKQPAVAA